MASLSPASLGGGQQVSAPTNRGQYKTIRKLGAGAFGTCWVVEDTRNAGSEPLVMKQIFIGMLEPDQTVDANKEARILERLHHPFIIAFVASFVELQFLCICTEFCEGGDLSQHLAAAKLADAPLPPARILGWLMQLAMALDYIHTRGVLHRDLKTQNIFLRFNNQVLKLGDFGIARVLSGTMDKAETFAGTPYNMPPELLQNEGYNSKSDMWALGCVLFEMCLLKRPFEGESLMGLMFKICGGTLPTLPDMYLALRPIAVNLLQRDPHARFSAKELLQHPLLKDLVKHAMQDVSRSTVARDKKALLQAGAGPRKQRSSSSATSNDDAGESTVGLSMQYTLSEGLPDPRSTPSTPPTPFAPAALPFAASVAAAPPTESHEVSHAERMRLRKIREADAAAERTKAAIAQEFVGLGVHFMCVCCSFSRCCRYHQNKKSFEQNKMNSTGGPPVAPLTPTLSRPASASSASSATRGTGAISSTTDGNKSPRPSSGRTPRTNPLPWENVPPVTPDRFNRTDSSSLSALSYDDRPIRPMPASASASPMPLNTRVPQPTSDHEASPVGVTEAVAAALVLMALVCVLRVQAARSSETAARTGAQPLSVSGHHSVLAGTVPDDGDAADLYYDDDGDGFEDDDDDFDDESQLKLCLSEALNTPDEDLGARAGASPPERAIAGSTMQALRDKAKRMLGDNFEAVYSFLTTSRKNKIPDAVIQKSLAKLVPNPIDCFIVDQLVYQELMA